MVQKIAYQKHHRSVQQESHQGVSNESHNTKRVDVVHGHAGDIGEEGHNAVGDGTGGGVVVERDKRVHLELGGAEETLDHDQTQGLEDDTGDLDDEAEHVELDLTEGGDHDTDDDDRHVAQGLEVGRGNAEGPSGNQGRDSVGGLQHLDEGHTEVQVGQVTTDQTQTEHDTNGNDGPAVGGRGHRDLVAGVQDCGAASQNLGHRGSENHVPCCEEQGYEVVC